MSTEFKPGQVWAWQDVDGAKGPHNVRFEIIEAGTDVTYQYRDAAGFDPETVYAANAEVIAAKAYRVDREPDATPAPLDPSKVKAGDTVTLERDGGRLPDQEVMVASGTGMGYTTVVLRGGLQVYITGPDAWTLTDHQPAPEPEPEWKPGTVAEGTVNGETVRGLIGHNDNNDGDVFVYWNEFARHVSLTGTLPADVRPLVVIDPEVARKSIIDALGSTLAKHVSFPEFSEAADAVAKNLGIEAP